MCRPETLLPLATIWLMTLQWGGLLTVALANALEHCPARELRCEILCHLVDLELQCAKCRSRAPVRFGKRTRGDFPLAREVNAIKIPQLDTASHLKSLRHGDGLCCRQFLAFLLQNSVDDLRKKWPQAEREEDARNTEKKLH
jgi:hypothetical protein